MAEPAEMTADVFQLFNTCLAALIFLAQNDV